VVYSARYILFDSLKYCLVLRTGAFDFGCRLYEKYGNSVLSVDFSRNIVNLLTVTICLDRTIQPGG
jgi:hypothetical protein